MCCTFSLPDLATFYTLEDELLGTEAFKGPPKSGGFVSSESIKTKHMHYGLWHHPTCLPTCLPPYQPACLHLNVAFPYH